MLSATQTSMRFLPLPVVGLAVQLLMGLIISKIRLDAAVVTAALISCVPPILTAVMSPSDSYWEYAFTAISLTAVAPDVIYTASNLIISDAFPQRTQALAGGVFNTVAQVGKAFGLGLSSIVASSISMQLEDTGKPHAYILMEGYRAAWWFILAITAITILISLWGLRNVPKLGVKRE
jgi:Major Facilitator Superfamily